MATRISFAYKLKPNVDPREYERWVTDVDAPFAMGRPTLLRYECVRLRGRLGSSEPAPFDYVETLHVTDVEDDQALVVGAEAERIAREWLEFVDKYVITFGDPVAGFAREGSG